MSATQIGPRPALRMPAGSSARFTRLASVPEAPSGPHASTCCFDRERRIANRRVGDHVRLSKPFDNRSLRLDITLDAKQTGADGSAPNQLHRPVRSPELFDEAEYLRQMAGKPVDPDNRVRRTVGTTHVTPPGGRLRFTVKELAGANRVSALALPAMRLRCACRRSERAACKAERRYGEWTA